VITAVDITTSLQNCGFELVSNLIVTQCGVLTAIQLMLEFIKTKVLLFVILDTLLEFNLNALDPD
jgi:hypothetical protein